MLKDSACVLYRAVTKLGWHQHVYHAIKCPLELSMALHEAKRALQMWALSTIKKGPMHAD